MKKNAHLILVIALLVLVLALGAGLRAANVGHSLSWDEAWNSNSIEDAARGNHDPETTFYPNMFRHPPAYNWLGVAFAGATGAGRDGISLFLEIVSILFALLLMVAVFMCGRDWFGDWAGLAGAFLLALMPAARVYDSWVKQESMTLFFGLVFLFFFFRKRYLLSGLFLGLALLTKEIVVFIPAALLVFLLATRRIDRLKGFGLSLLVAVPMSLWWFLFFSRVKGQFAQFFLGTFTSAQVWHQPFWYYVTRIPADIGWGGVAAVLAGVGLTVSGFLRGGAGEENADYSEREMALFLLLWIAVVYLVLSFSYGKPPWMTYAALPAFALLGGWGIAGVIDLAAKKSRRIAIAVAVASIVLIAGLNIPFGFDQYMKRADVLYARALADKAVARYVNEKDSDAKVLLQDRNNSPVLAFYLDGYHSGGMALLGAEPVDGEAGPGKSVFMMPDDTGIEQLFGHAAIIGPGFVILDCDSELAAAAAAAVTPEKIGGTCVFETGALVRGASP